MMAFLTEQMEAKGWLPGELPWGQLTQVKHTSVPLTNVHSTSGTEK